MSFGPMRMPLKLKFSVTAREPQDLSSFIPPLAMVVAADEVNRRWDCLSFDEQSMRDWFWMEQKQEAGPPCVQLSSAPWTAQLARLLSHRTSAASLVKYHCRRVNCVSIAVHGGM